MGFFFTFFGVDIWQTGFVRPSLQFLRFVARRSSKSNGEKEKLLESQTHHVVTAGEEEPTIENHFLFTFLFLFLPLSGERNHACAQSKI